MSDMESSPVHVKEETSNSFAESDDKSIKSPAIDSENDDSEVERSENEEEIGEHEIEDNKSESNEQPHLSAAVDEDNENSINSDDLEAKKNDDDDQPSTKDDQSSVKDEQLSAKEELDSDNDLESDAESNQNQAEQEEEAKSDQEELESDEEMHEKKRVEKKEADEIFGNSDSEAEDEIEPNRAAGKRKLDSSNEDSDDEFFSPKKKKSARVIRDSDDEQSDSNEEGGKLKRLNEAESDDELENELKELDNQDENAEQSEKQNDEDQEELDSKKVLPDISSSEDELDDDRPNRNDGLVYDFDIMMAKRKEQNARNRKRRNTDLINDSDDFIAHLITQMRQAAEEDFELNKERKAATRKMKLLPSVQAYLRKIDLRESFLDSGVLSVIADWLTRLPDGSLPNLQVRETMLKILLEMNVMDVDRLKTSGIGKAIMFLFKHPKETKDNKRKASQLIMNWSRPIFNCETDYQAISKEDREQRDYDLMHKVQRKRSEEAAASQQANSASETVLRPGDKGWVSRARVPAPSTKDYVVRPKSTVDIEIGKSAKRQANRLDKHLRSFQEKKRSSKMQRAVKISIEGRKL